MALAEHLEKLRHFYRLSSFRSIKSGAHAMGISQAGLSKAIANLEDILEVQLFIRTNEGLVLTKAGDILLESAKKIFAETSHAESKLQSLGAAKVPSKFKVGMYDSITIYFFPDLSSYLKQIYPTLDFELVVDRSSNLSAMINQNRIDLAVGVNFSEISEGNFFPLFEDYYSFYCSPQLVVDASKLPIIYHPDAIDADGKSNMKHISPILGERLSHQVFNFETIKELVVLGHGIGVLPTKVAKPLVEKRLLAQVKVTRMQNLFGRHSIGFLAGKRILRAHPDFVEDICRLGVRWSKT